MRVKQVSLSNFRNYAESSAELSPGRNILIGENAQGKTNFLEAIELIATGDCGRAQSDLDLIRKGADYMRVEIAFESRGSEEVVAMSLRPAAKEKRRAVDKQMSINGLTQSVAKGAFGRLVVVSFKSQDLYLLRGGPKFRRDWIDSILQTLRPAYREILSKYTKVVTQRNRLLKLFFEQGSVSDDDREQLKVWDLQLAKFGSQIVKQRLDLLARVLPRAERFQEHISGKREVLTAQYIFSAAESDRAGDEAGDTTENSSAAIEAGTQLEDRRIAETLLDAMDERRREELARKQTCVGPHRDDIVFRLNGANAVEFGSQGQQRSLVLSLKLAELELVSEVLQEKPILLLDDVLAELDLNRQGLLMSLVGDTMQTVITTTNVEGFRSEWLEGALFLHVRQGAISTVETPVETPELV